MYVIVWEFQAKPDAEEEFEQVYGPAGEWAQLFTRGEGYLGTELHREANGKARYLVIDRWGSETAFQAFRERWASAYEALDRRCELLTDRETPIGSFLSVGQYHEKGT